MPPAKMASTPPNIYIIGAQSTGKTTLVNAMAAFFHAQDNTIKDRQNQPDILKEVARGVLNQHKLTANDITSSSSSALRIQRLILEAQVEAETAVQRSHHWYISDRSALDPLVYAELYSGEDGLNALQRDSTWQRAAKWMKNSVVIVCEAGGKWLIDDGVRLMPKDKNAWYKKHQSFCTLLDRMDMEYNILPSSISKIEERIIFVVNHWEKKCG